MTSSSRMLPPGLDHGQRAVCRRPRRGRREREKKRIGGGHGACERKVGALRLGRGDPRRVHAAHLPGTDAERTPRPPQKDDRVALHETWPRENANSRSCVCAGVGAFLGHDAKIRRRDVCARSALCSRKPRRRCASRPRCGPGALSGSATSSHPHVLLPGDHLDRIPPCSPARSAPREKLGRHGFERRGVRPAGRRR